MGAWARKVKGLKQKREKTQRHRQQYGDDQGERGRRKVEEGNWGTNGDRRRLESGYEHTIQMMCYRMCT